MKGHRQSDRRGEEIDTGSRNSFRKKEVSSLISEWESRARGGEEMERLELPEDDDHGRGRRMSQEFQQVRQKFVEKEGGAIIDVKTAEPILSFATSCNNAELKNMQGKGAVRKINFTEYKYPKLFSSIVGRGGAPLARISANGKRKVDSKEGGGGCKKRKGGGD